MVETSWLQVSHSECARLSNSGSGEARFWLGHFYWTGRNGISLDAKEAVKIWSGGGLVGNHKTQYMIALCLKKGLGGHQKDVATAERMFRLAAEGLLAEAASGDKVSEAFYQKWLAGQRKRGGHRSTEEFDLQGRFLV